jgi:hypothetical protein
MMGLTTNLQLPTAKTLQRSSQSNSQDLPLHPLLLSPRLRPNPILRRRLPKLKLLQKLLSLRKRPMFLKLKQVLLPYLLQKL